ncbi:MAG: PQQ-binding-like beta-propeller repeat protein [Bythopirellula sp.]|nr:PQQ-binding-like beta-propeller repeat protein [Bythopirellula sp.]
MKQRIEITIIVSLLCLCSTLLPAADWPFFRGDELATAAVKEELPAEMDVVWKHTLPDSGYEATAVIVEGIVYIGDVDGTFYAYRLSDGSEVWKKKFDNSGFLAGAAFHENRLYVGDFNGVIRALEAKDGKELWQYQAKGESYAAPNVVDGRVLATTEAGELLALNAETGELEWQFQIEAPLRCWPTVVDGRVLLAGCDERVHAVDVATGKEVAGVEIDGPTGSTPGMFNEHALFGTEQGSFYSINSKNMEITWRHVDPENIDAIHTAAAVDARVAVYGTQGKLAYALKPATGDVAWTFPVRSHVESSPVIAGDSAFLATKRGMIHRVDVNTGKELWNYEAGGDFQASFAIADGKLVIGNTDGTLYCFGAK